MIFIFYHTVWYLQSVEYLGHLYLIMITTLYRNVCTLYSPHSTMIIHLLIATLTCYALTAGQDDPPIVNTPSGTVQGTRVPLHAGSGLVTNSFLGVPFAKPPVDELRFEVLYNHYNYTCILFCQICHWTWQNIIWCTHICGSICGVHPYLKVNAHFLGS